MLPALSARCHILPRAPFFSFRSLLVLPLPGCTRLFPRTVSSPSRTPSFLLAFCLVVYLVMSMYTPVATGFTSLSLAWCQTSSVARACNAPLSSHSHALPRLPKKHIVTFETGCAIVGLQEDRSLYPLRLAPPLRLHVRLVRFPLCPHRLVDVLSIFYRPCWIRQRRRVAFDTPTMKGRRGLYWSSR